MTLFHSCPSLLILTDLAPCCSIGCLDEERDFVEFKERYRRQADTGAGSVAAGSPVPCRNAWTRAGADVWVALMAALDKA